MQVKVALQELQVSQTALFGGFAVKSGLLLLVGKISWAPGG